MFSNGIYDIDFSIGSVLILAFLLTHYVQNRRTGSSPERFFAVFIIYVLILSLADIVNVLVLRLSTASSWVCLFSCSIYLTMELAAVAILTFALPILVTDATRLERRRWKLLLIPVSFVAVLILVVNPFTGAIFTIGPNHFYITGPFNWVLSASNTFYVVAMLGIFVRDRQRIEHRRYAIFAAMVVTAAGGIVAQAIWWDTRLTTFTLALLTLEMYLGFQIPENRYDPLTGLLARNSFYEATRRLLVKHPKGDYVVVYSNIEEFKAVNDLYGVQKGDEILACLGQSITSFTDGIGTAGRLQGDHLVVCIPTRMLDLTALMAATSHQAMERRFGCEVHSVFGLYRVEDPDQPVSLMCDCARLAMKQLGASHVERYAFYRPDMRETFLNDHEMTNQMESSLEDGRFEVYLQPLYDLETFEFVSAEALVRWNHPERGLLTPGDFIPVFERNGLITQLDTFVWESTCQLLRGWIDGGLPVVPISVNTSAVDLRPGLDDTIVGMVERFGLDPSLLRIEITESAFVLHLDSLRRLIDHLHDQGFTVMMDDFGTGYSSLSMLDEMSFDQVKMDRTFIADILRNERSRVIVESTVRLAEQLGLDVVSEGVETLEQALLLRDMGVRTAQGYYFSEPMPADRFEQLLRQGDVG